MHVRPPSLCELEISLQGVKLIMSLEDEYDAFDEVRTDNDVQITSGCLSSAKEAPPAGVFSHFRSFDFVHH